jgi:N-acetylmuramoyl-L-alanine amidase
MIIFIDPGHGGKQRGGGSHYGLDEADYCLEMALRIQRIAKQEKIPHEVLLSRDGDYYLSQAGRARRSQACHADFVISLHVNSTDLYRPHQKGAMLFHWTGNDRVKAYNEEVVRRFPKELQRASHESYAAYPNFWAVGVERILCVHGAISTTVIEMGFGNWIPDNNALQNVGNRVSIARAIIDALPVFEQYWRIKQ